MKNTNYGSDNVSRGKQGIHVCAPCCCTTIFFWGCRKGGSASCTVVCKALCVRPQDSIPVEQLASGLSQLLDNPPLTSCQNPLHWWAQPHSAMKQLLFRPSSWLKSANCLLAQRVQSNALACLLLCFPWNILHSSFLPLDPWWCPSKTFNSHSAWLLDCWLNFCFLISIWPTLSVNGDCLWCSLLVSHSWGQAHYILLCLLHYQVLQCSPDC